MQDTQGFMSEVELVTMLQLNRRRGDAAARRRGGAGARVFGQHPGAGDVIGMRVGLHRPQQLESVLAQSCQITFDLLVDRIDDHSLTRGLVEQHIGKGAGGSVEKLNRLHGGFSLTMGWMYALA